jgi:hypothetical protein
MSPVHSPRSARGRVLWLAVSLTLLAEGVC